MKGILSSFLLLTMALSIVSGCDTGRDRAITGDYFDRGAGKSMQAAARIDSLKNYPSHFNAISNALTGKYGDAQGFMLIKFTRPSSTTLAGLERVRLKVTVSGVWSGGTREFGLYRTAVNWTDSTDLDPGVYLSNLGTPLSVNVDSTETISSMVFELNNAGIDYIKTWGSTGAFLLKNTDRGNSVMNVYTYYSSYQPIMELISRTAAGADTTNTNAIDTAYAYNTGINKSEGGIISDAAASGFVLYTSLPDSFSRTNAFNSGKLVIPITRSQIPTGTTMHFGAYLLTAPFGTLSGAKTSDSHYTEFDVGPTDTKIELNISGMLGDWAAAPSANYGILFKPTQISSSPAQIVLTPPDSVGFLYTTLPEVE